MQGIIDDEYERLELIDKFGLNITDSGSSYDFMKIDSLSRVRDKFETTLLTLSSLDESKYEDLYLRIKNLKVDFDNVKDCISIIRSIKEGRFR